MVQVIFEEDDRTALYLSLQYLNKEYRSGSASDLNVQQLNLPVCFDSGG